MSREPSRVSPCGLRLVALAAHDDTRTPVGKAVVVAIRAERGGRVSHGRTVTAWRKMRKRAARRPCNCRGRRSGRGFPVRVDLEAFHRGCPQQYICRQCLSSGPLAAFASWVEQANCIQGHQMRGVPPHRLQTAGAACSASKGMHRSKTADASSANAARPERLTAARATPSHRISPSCSGRPVHAPDVAERIAYINCFRQSPQGSRRRSASSAGAKRRMPPPAAPGR